jgi:translation initiation factor IF-3
LSCSREERPISRIVKANDPALRGGKVRLIDADNNQLGLLGVREALLKAEEEGMDLVLVADKAEPPVCRLMNFGKYIYEKNKRERDQKRKQQQHKVKEVKFHANIDPHDYEIKRDHIIAFLEKSHRVKVSLVMRGREMAHKELGLTLMRRLVEELREHATAHPQGLMSQRS